MLDICNINTNNIGELVNLSVQSKCTVFSQFLDSQDCSDLLDIVKKQDVYCEHWGGYPNAERRMIGVDVTRKDRVENVLNVKNGMSIPLLSFPIVPVLVRSLDSDTRIPIYNLFQELNKVHLACGLIGDTLEHVSGYVIFANGSASQKLKDNLTILGNLQVITKVDSIDRWLNYEPDTEIVTVASNRLDALISSIFRLSREDGRDAVHNEMVKVNDVLNSKPSAVVRLNDMIDLKTRGRALIRSFDETARGRLKISFVRYRRFKQIV